MEQRNSGTKGGGAKRPYVAELGTAWRRVVTAPDPTEGGTMERQNSAGYRTAQGGMTSQSDTVQHVAVRAKQPHHRTMQQRLGLLNEQTGRQIGMVHGGIA
jgi:hypothetical protein